MPLFTRASGFGVHGGSFTDVAGDSVHVHVEAHQASFEMPGSSCSRKRKRGLDKDKGDDHDTTPQIVKRRRLELKSVLAHGSSYELHLARQSGRVVVVKVFGGPWAEERFAANLTSCRRHLHPNVGQMIGRSPDDSESPFIIYRCAESTNRLHPIIAKALRTDLLRSIHLAMRTVKGFAAGIDYLNRQGFPLQNSLSPFLDILVGDNDEPLIVVNPAVAALGDSFPSNNGNHGWAVFSSLCRETFKEVNTILYDDTPKRNHDDYESSSRPETLTTASGTLGPVENDNLELSSSSTLTLAQPNKPRRELWWIDPGHTYPSLNSIARCFDDFLALIPSSSSPPLRRLHNSEEGRSLHQCPGYLREEIVLGSDLARSAIISHSTPNAMERCSVCGEIVPSGAGSEEGTAVSAKVALSGAQAGLNKRKGGAVQAKSGCYTCRIRRKKCDERPNGAGQCETCVRLRIECLGFGVERPEWLRESHNVADIRERIKTFLAAQDMIKGHSGSGPRSGSYEPPTLRLAPDSDTYSESSGSPPTPTLSLSAENAHTSSMRDMDWPLSTYNQSGLYPPTTLRSHSDGYEPPTLRLSPDSDTYRESSESPPTPTLSLSAENDRHRHHTSSMRDMDWPLSTYHQSGLYPPTTLRSHSDGYEPPTLRLSPDSDTYRESSESPPTPTLSLSAENDHTSSMRDMDWPLSTYNQSGLYPPTTLRSHSDGYEPPTLRLSPDSDTYRESSESPPTPTLSLSAENDRHRHHTSSMRDMDWPLSTYHQSGLYPTALSSTLRSVSPYASDSSQGSVNDFTTYHQVPINSSTSLAASPAIASSFSALYHLEFPFEEYGTMEDSDGLHAMFKSPTDFLPRHLVDNLVVVHEA